MIQDISVMDPNPSFTLSITLPEKSSIATANHVWEKPAVKAKILEFFLENSAFDLNGVHPDERWQEITKFALKDLNKMELSNSKEMTKDIVDRVDVLGKKIYYWINHMIDSDEVFELNLIREIEWTVNGTINEKKTFESALRKTSDVPESAFRYACLLVQKNFIKQHLRSMTFWIQSLFMPLRLKDSKYNVYTIITMYICWCYGRNSIGAGKVYENVRKLRSPAYELFRICITLGFTEAAKYFFTSKLKKEEQQKIIIEAAEECATFQGKFNLGDYRKEKAAELLVLLINNMTCSDKITFMAKHITDIFKLFLFLWPYQNLCLPMLDFIWPKLSEADHEKILELILFSLIQDTAKQYHVNKKFHQEVLKNSLEKISSNLIFKKFCVEKYWLKLFKLRDFATLCITISHSDLFRVRNTLIQMCYEDLKKFIADGKFDIVDSYLSLLLLSDTEKDKFKSYFNFLPDLIDNGQFEMADKFLDWRCGSEEQKSMLKRKINPQSVLDKFFAEKKNNVAISFSNWYFNFTKEKNQVKDIINKALCDGFFDVWGKTCVCGSEFAKNKCLEFLKPFLKRDDDINSFMLETFKKDEQFVKIFCDHLEFVEGFDTIDELFKFGLIKPQIVKEIKRKVVDNIDWWIDAYGFNDFLMVNALVNWAVQNEVQKKNIIATFVNSKKGASLSIAILNNCKYDTEIPLLKLFNTWIKPYGDIPKIKEHLRVMKNGDVTENSIIGVIKLLDKLEQEGVVTSSYISCLGFSHVKERFSLPIPFLNGSP